MDGAFAQMRGGSVGRLAKSLEAKPEVAFVRGYDLLLSWFAGDGEVCLRTSFTQDT